jgi:hypothetical protein
MSVSKKEEWYCPKCGTSNYYLPNRCYQCGARRDWTSSRNHKVVFGLDTPITNARKRIIFTSLTSLALLVWLYLVWSYHKWDAQWGPFNVLIPALLVAAIISWWISRRSWFRDSTMPTRWRFMIIPVIGFIVCAWAGIYFTEPIEPGGSVTSADRSQGRHSADYQYNFHLSRASEFFLWSSIWDIGEGAADAADGDEGCLLLMLVLLVVLLIAGSFVIPHFWVLATFVLLVTMAIFSYREWRLLEQPNKLLQLR